MTLLYFVLGVITTIVLIKLWDLWFKLPSTRIINMQEDLIAAFICLLIQQAEENGCDSEKESPLYWLELAKQIILDIQKEEELDDKVSYR